MDTRARNRRRALLATTVAAAAAGLAAAWLLPRGPATQPEALVSLAGATGLGVALGAASRSRWSIVLVPAAFAGGFELMRLGILGTTGPTVDAFQPGSMYGLIALVVGRGVSGALLLWPLAVGAGAGVAIAAWRDGDRSRRPGALALVVGAIATLSVVALGVLFAGPARTAPITAPDGSPLEGSVAEFATVPLGGGDQVVLLRGRDATNPVILYLAGGPGGTDIGAARMDTGLESDFVVATWDQRGTGKSYGAIEPSDTFTVDRMVQDTVELTDWLRERFGQERIYLVGNSWGSLLGALAVEQAPDRYAAFVGTGQMVSIAETDRMFWEDTLAWARQHGLTELVATLETNGPPPYPRERMPDYEAALSHEHEWNPYPELNLDREMPAILFVPEYHVMDRVNGFRGLLDTLSALYPQLQELDLREAVPSIDVPVYVVIGAHETRGRAVPAREWFDQVEAPSKELIVFDHSGHRPQFEEPAVFAELMRRVAASSEAAMR